MANYSNWLASIGGDASNIPTTGFKSWTPDLNNINQIKLFQKSMGLKPDGIIGTQTINALKSIGVTSIPASTSTTGTSSKKNYSSSSSSYGSSNANSNTGKKINVPELFKDNTGTSVVANNNAAINNDNNGNITSGFMNYLSNQNSPLPSNDGWNFPRSQTSPVQQTNTITNGYVNPELSMFANDPRIRTGIVIPEAGNAVTGSGSSAAQEVINLQNTLSNKWGNTSYGDAWTQGNGVLGGISNMWDKFTSPNGSMANPTPSGAENFLKSLGGVGTLAGGVADLMYKSKLADLMGRQVSQQEALQNATLKSKNDWEKSYAGSFK